MIEAASVNLDLDLRPFSRYLSAQGIAHRITEESGRQVIWVRTENIARSVREALRSWQQQPELLPELEPAVRPGGGGSRFAQQVFNQLWSAPISSLLLVLCLLVAVASNLGREAGRVEFLFYPLLDSDNVIALLRSISGPGDALRTLTPMLLHFGELHLVFNMLWLWYFGKQLEPLHSPWLYLVLILLMAFISNTTQYLSVHFNNFGGMSGVVYGLVGYTWIIHNFMPRSRLLLNNSMFFFFVVALVLMEVVAGSFIATAAHIGGLISGILLGVMMVAYYRGVLRRETISRR